MLGSKFTLTRNTASGWGTSVYILASGEMGFATDTGLLKIGDGKYLLLKFSTKRH
jgi:hypothetical protein